MLKRFLSIGVRKKILWCGFLMIFLLLALFVRIVVFERFEAGYYAEKAEELHERERSIKASRGLILDRNGKILADNKSVCTVSVIHNQITDEERVTVVLAKELGLDEAAVRKKVKKYTSMERIRSNVEKEVGDRIRAYHLDGVKVDEDCVRYYPYGTLASKVLGFAGADNQGIIGLESYYESVLKGKPGIIYAATDARGVEVERIGERREEPVPGDDLLTTLDINIQSYATQLASQAMLSKQADGVMILVMNPKNGEIYACVNVPEFDLNAPFSLPDDEEAYGEEKQELLNKMWRNHCINDTYEPGSTFKIITAAAGLESGAITTETPYFCSGAITVDDRIIHCHKRTGHGAQDFVHCMMNSCNPALITVGLKLGVDAYYQYFEQFGLLQKTGIDLPGEARTIMHRKENMGNVELATVAFGQSFQVTPVQMLTTVSSLINGGVRITPHFAKAKIDSEDATVEAYEFPVQEGILSEETSETLRMILEKVVSEGSGKNGKVEGFSIGGKTATSQTLPRSSHKYIASFIGFAPAEDPEVIAIAIVNNPQGIYYGGTVAAPIVRQLFENILPYLGIMEYNK